MTTTLATSRTQLPEEILQGVGISAGIGIGPGYLLETVKPETPYYHITPEDLPQELMRFERACQKAYNQIAKLQTKAETLPAQASEEIILLLDVHLAMVSESRLTRGVVARITQHLINAEEAVAQEITAQQQPFEEMEDNYLATRVQEIEEVGRRLIRNLLEYKYVALKDVPHQGVVISEDVSPADTAFMNPEKISGIVSLTGGKQSHTAILARSLGLPAVAGLPHMPNHLRDESIIIVDGINGLVIINPSVETFKDYRAKQRQYLRQHSKQLAASHQPAITKDGTEIQVYANFSAIGDLERIAQSGAEGIGLLRTEFMLLNRNDLPSVQEQYDILADVMRGMNGRAVTIRTFDIGADKQTPALSAYIGHEENPALGLRALRLSMAVPELLDNQLTAILRASSLGKVRVLLPMVTHLSQVQFVRERLNSLQQQLIKRRVAVSREMLPLGIMVETPAAAIMADEFAAISEFLAIGTNDLVQYTLATDRGNDAVAHLSQPDHPAVTSLLRQVVAAGQKYQRPVSVCGEMAGDIDTVGHLVGLGVRNLSMVASSIPSVKERIRKLDLNT